MRGGSSPPFPTWGIDRQNSYRLYLLTIWGHGQIIIEFHLLLIDHYLLHKRPQERLTLGHFAFFDNMPQVLNVGANSLNIELLAALYCKVISASVTTLALPNSSCFLRNSLILGARSSRFNLPVSKAS
jgi:hypothetical protein